MHKAIAMLPITILISCVFLFVYLKFADRAHTTKAVVLDLVPTLELKCLPGSVFTYDHNICYCDDEGEKITCKRKMYSTLYPELRAYQLQNLTVNCSVQAKNKNIFDIGCHKCICNEDKKHATCVSSSCNNKNYVYNYSDKCIPGSVIMNKCNGCICGPDGKPTCTNLDCYAVHGIKKTNDVICVPNSDVTVECNVCGCNSLGTSITCEKVGCEQPNFVHEHILNVTMNCTPENLFDYNSCQKCKCSRNGEYAMCVGVPCSKQYELEIVQDTVEQCNPGMIFANDCNICICGKDKKGVCTTLNCDMEYRFKYGELTYTKPSL